MFIWEPDCCLKTHILYLADMSFCLRVVYRLAHINLRRDLIKLNN